MGNARAILFLFRKVFQCHYHGVDHSGNQEQNNKGAVNILPFVVFPFYCVNAMVNSGEEEKEYKCKEDGQLSFNSPIGEIDKYGDCRIG